MAAVDMGAHTGPTDDLDDLFDYSISNDIFRDVDTNMDVPANSTTVNTAGEKENGGGLGIDEEVKVTKKRAPVAKLDENRLLSPAGIPKLRRVGKVGLKLRGKGHEYSDVARLLNFYQLWLDDLYPRAKFADGLAIIEKLGHSRRMHTMRKEWINEGKPRDSLEDVEPKTHATNDEQRAAGPAQRPSTAEKAVERRQTAFATDALDDDFFEATPSVSEKETASPRPAAASGLFISDNEEAENGPPEDDLDALLAEEETTKDNIGGVQQDQVHGNDPMDKNFDDEMEAMAGFEDMCGSARLSFGRQPYYQCFYSVLAKYEAHHKETYALESYISVLVTSITRELDYNSRAVRSIDVQAGGARDLQLCCESLFYSSMRLPDTPPSLFWMVEFLLTFRTLAFLLPIVLFNLAYTAAEPIIQDDHDPSRLLDFSGDSNVVQVLRSSYEHLVERYVPDFVGIDRSIIGRAGDAIQALGNNAPGKSNIEGGQSQFYTFPKKALLGEQSPSTPGLPSIIGQRALQNGDEWEITAELGKRQNTNGVMLYISLNTCEQPTSKGPISNGAPDQLKLYVSTSPSNQKPDASKNDFAVPVDGGFASLNITANNDVFFGVSAPTNSEFTGIYNYELTASIDDYYASYHDETYTYFVDSDTNSALFYTNDTTSQNSSTAVFKQWMSLSNSPPFSVYVQNQDNPSILGMQNSMCALKNYAQVRGSTNTDTSMTISGDGQPKQQFHVKGLNGSSAYYAIMGVDGNSTDSGGGVVKGGGTVWKSANFSTKSDNNCAIVFNLPFCSDVAYAVPSNTSQPNTTALGLMYDGWASDMYTNFSKSLQQIPCNTSSSAQYSLTRNCTDCASAYKQWLCAVTIPRCQDFSSTASYLQPRNVAQNFPNNTSGSGSLFSADNRTKVYMNSSRNPLIDSDIAPGPYKEVLPCKDLCYHLVQNCPARLQFVCPLEGYGLNYTYGSPQVEGIGPGEITCNALNTNTNAATSLRGFVMLGASVGISTLLLFMTL